VPDGNARDAGVIAQSLKIDQLSNPAGAQADEALKQCQHLKLSASGQNEQAVSTQVVHQYLQIGGKLRNPLNFVKNGPIGI